MTTLVLVGRFLNDYARNPVNLLLLAVIPTVFVVVVASSLADYAQLLGGPAGASVQTVTAGWAAAFLAGIAMYFQTAQTRDTDRRVVIAGLPATRMALARLLTGGCLALLAATTALIALALRTGIDSVGYAVAGTLMFSVIYVAIGAAVGSVVSSPVTGTVIVLFIWILDVFFGPAMGAADRIATRGLPTHYVTLWMLDLPSGPRGRVGDLGWALATTLAAACAAWALAAARTRTVHRRVKGAPPGTRRDQAAGAWRAACKDARRTPSLWALLVIVPVVFILGADAVTPNKPITVTLNGPEGAFSGIFPMPDVHVATMAPIAIASLSALIGLFTVLDSHDGDRRVALAGMRSAALLTARLEALVLATLGATAISLATAALVFHAVQWLTYAAASLLIAITYGLIGALLAPIFGRVGGVFIAFLLPFLDIGIVQSPMLHASPTAGSQLLPGYGGSRVLLDGALMGTFDDWVPLLIGLAWPTALVLAVALAYRRATQPVRPLPQPDVVGPSSHRTGGTT
ncbi:MAG: ABC transporter permease [Actinomycetota bacterium]|nr:ABC transporter permease [Actinomycetota bacterium]